MGRGRDVIVNHIPNIDERYRNAIEKRSEQVGGRVMRAQTP